MRKLLIVLPLALAACGTTREEENRQHRELMQLQMQASKACYEQYLRDGDREAMRHCIQFIYDDGRARDIADRELDRQAIDSLRRSIDAANQGAWQRKVFK